MYKYSMAVMPRSGKNFEPFTLQNGLKCLFDMYKVTIRMPRSGKIFRISVNRMQLNSLL